MAEDEMVRKHHQLSRHEFEQTRGNGGGQKMVRESCVGVLVGGAGFLPSGVQ